MRRCLLILLASIVSLSSLEASAMAGAFRSVSTSPNSIDDEFQRLKRTSVDFNNFGQVCEAVAEHDFEAAYPHSRFEIVNGVAYGDEDGTLGELDLVVFDRASDLVVAIGEVKCWRDNLSALSKALEQKTRYQQALKSARALFFTSLSDKRVFNAAQFSSPQNFKTVGPSGAMAQGFDLELRYSLKELMDLRERLIKCKSSKRCH